MIPIMMILGVLTAYTYQADLLIEKNKVYKRTISRQVENRHYYKRVNYKVVTTKEIVK